MSACSRVRSRSASLPVTPNNLVKNSIRTSPELRNKFDCGNARQKAVGGGFRRNESREPRDLNRGRAIRLRNHENALRRVLSADHRILRFRIQPDRTRELAVIDPMSQHELILVLDARVDEIAEKSALDAVVRLRWIIGRPIWHATTDDSVSVIAPSGSALSSNWLASWIDAAHVRANGTAQALRIA